MSLLYKAQGNTDKSYSYLESYASVKDSLSSELLQDKIADFEIKYQTAEKEQQILEQRASIAEKALEIQKRNQIIISIVVIAVFLALIGFLFYRQQQLKNRQLKKEQELEMALAKIDTQNKLQDQRLRISRDLHDNIGSQLTFLISSIDNMNYAQQLGKQATSDKLTDLSNYTRSTIDELRDTIWAMNKDDIKLSDIYERTNTMVAKFNTNTVDGALIETRFQEGIETVFNSVRGMHIFRIIQESLNNAIKYANASLLIIDISKVDGTLTVIIKDNGSGFDTGQELMGNGLKNMKERAAMMQSDLEIQSNEKGTTVTLIIPINH